MSNAPQNHVIDAPTATRKGEELNASRLNEYLRDSIAGMSGELDVQQFPSGFSNLTYMLGATVNGMRKEYVLRRPPFGANIKSAHDMEREYKVLHALRKPYPKVPEPIVYCDDADVLGAPFYVMERVQGVILRSKKPEGLDLSAPVMKRLSTMLADNLAELHSVDISLPEIQALGKPDGYVRRQVEGWIKRYENAKTDDIPGMDSAAAWLLANIPDETAPQNAPTLIHNDYKYDNVVFAPDLSAINAVLDWEMATIGDPLMDLGTTLGYWAEDADPIPLKMFGLTPLEGNLNREELVARYAEITGRDVSNIVFYYVFGLVKIVGIAQQIYARFKKGFTQDQRFGGLIFVIQAGAEMAHKALQSGKLRNF
ncbi:MAG: phosphotransferase family protein [Candidatus Kapabacteria bacterium]|jgi:aminoglycoside phosphotransferase (APT) family kinase protein|nr:phosphotransferase family protein [Candidatus Kapabacteria bacterium]